MFTASQSSCPASWFSMDVAIGELSAATELAVLGGNINMGSNTLNVGCPSVSGLEHHFLDGIPMRQPAVLERLSLIFCKSRRGFFCLLIIISSPCFTSHLDTFSSQLIKLVVRFLYLMNDRINGKFMSAGLKKFD